MPTMIVYAMIRMWRRLIERSKMMNKITDRVLRNKMRRLKKSEEFRNYQIEFIPLPQYPMCDMIYNIPLHTVWINTAAELGANVSRVEFERW